MENELNYQDQIPETNIEGAKTTVIDLVEKMEEMVINARSIPLSANCIVNREELLLLVGMINNNLPNEIKQAKWLLDRQYQVIEQARKTANTVIAQAETKVALMINEHEITTKATQLGQQIVEEAYQEADVIAKNIRDYMNRQLEDLEENLTRILLSVQKDRNELKGQ